MEARFLVTFRAADGIRYVVSVWADSPNDAVRLAREWIEQTQEHPLDDAESDVELLASEPDLFDLGIASADEGVNHRRSAPTGAI